MLYKFKSKATGDVIMLQLNGQHVLEIIGKASHDKPSTQGILLVEDMPHALSALQAAIAHEEAHHKELIAKAKAENLPPPHFDEVGLRQRTQPFMEMLRECMQAQEPIVWGV